MGFESFSAHRDSASRRFGFESADSNPILTAMHRWALAFAVMALVLPGSVALAASGRVIKILPLYLDLKGRQSLSPSLYERDAYQAELRQHPEKQSGIRFDVQWKAKNAAHAQLRLRLELRGAKTDASPSRTTLELPVQQTGVFSHWTGMTLSGGDFRQFGELVAWRVTLWDGDALLGEQKSFLWEYPASSGEKGRAK